MRNFEPHDEEEDSSTSLFESLTKSLSFDHTQVQSFKQRNGLYNSSSESNNNHQGHSARTKASLTIHNMADEKLFEQLLPASSLDFFGTSKPTATSSSKASLMERMKQLKKSSSSTSENSTEQDNTTLNNNDEEEDDFIANLPPPLTTAEEIRKFRKENKIKIKGIVSQMDPDMLLAPTMTSASIKKKQISERRDLSTQEEASSTTMDNADTTTVFTSPYKPFVSFLELKNRYPDLVRDYLYRNIRTKLKYQSPTPVQMQAIPVLMSRKECLVAAPTGSGKTVAFCLPMLCLLGKPRKEGFRGLIITPTKILADQIYRNLEVLGSGKDWKIRLNDQSAVDSEAGESQGAVRDNHKFQSKRNDILISTPMRLLTMIKSGIIDLTNVEMLVFDEADRLFDLGFIEQVDEILSFCTNPNLVKAYFSATIPLSLEHTLKTQTSLLKPDAVQVSIGVRNAGPDTIHQKLVFVGSEEGKLLALKERIRVEGLKPPVLIFVQSIERAKQLYKEMLYTLTNTTGMSSSSTDTGASDPLDYCVDYIHGKRSDKKNHEVIQNFRTGKTWALICTDVMARGLDFKNISCVINYDFPTSVSNYIHRIGRTGRAGQRGEALTFFTYDDIPLLKNIADVLKNSGCPVPDYMSEIKQVSEQKMTKMAIENIKATKIGRSKKPEEDETKKPLDKKERRKALHMGREKKKQQQANNSKLTSNKAVKEKKPQEEKKRKKVSFVDAPTPKRNK
ncbi:hypothetical protein C9374_014648 [Naegleria lovaniensis]|uniref:RNA helicase n=1 Tax=Naegleria lovaniensis TaxID=51637 RepID=A0AA88H1C8_NAELO|nr:uncharacterized protein C9374_014648 [Naegleria lovaniensis]KAG2389248.1 hypothetical protein C9374_014648 [Naegleria lovaniensis]